MGTAFGHTAAQLLTEGLQQVCYYPSLLITNNEILGSPFHLGF